MKKEQLLLIVTLCIGNITWAIMPTITPSVVYKKNPNTTSGFSKTTPIFLPQQTINFALFESGWRIADTVFTTYNANGTIDSTFVAYGVANYPQFNRKRTYFYNTNNKITAFHEFRWNTNGSKWDSSITETYKYDTYQNISEHLMYSFDNSGMKVIKGGEKDITYNYDANHRIIEKVYTPWDNWHSEFDSISKQTFTYSIDGKLKEKILSRLENGNFFAKEKTANIVWYKQGTNIDDGLLKSCDYYHWQDSSNSLVLTYKEVINYDSHDKPTEDTMYVTINGEWSIADVKTHAYTYNNEGALLEDLYVENSKTRKRVHSNFLNYTGVKEKTKNIAKSLVYPNPAQHSVIFEGEYQANSSVEIFDLQGRKVLSQPILSSKTIIEKGNLQGGVYIYRIVNNEGIIETGNIVFE